jgi:hypothetical protein
MPGLLSRAQVENQDRADVDHVVALARWIATPSGSTAWSRFALPWISNICHCGVKAGGQGLTVMMLSPFRPHEG